MSIPLYVANWKMNKSLDESIQFVKTFIPQIRESNGEVVVVPPAIFLTELSKLTSGTKLSLGCQNIHYEKAGAFTGELSAGMVKDFCSYVIIGHSERRHLFNETDEMVNKKLLAALNAGLKPILCVGETLSQRGEAEKVVLKQLNDALAYVPSYESITIAYEPVWAIGTGKTATPEDAQAMHALIRAELSRRKASCRILYGGSVKPENIASLMTQVDIDGVLVGGASLDIESFAWIVRGGTDAGQ